jgi:hypothetical protein
MVKSAENWMRSNLELLPVINVKSRPRYISAQKISTLLESLELATIQDIEKKETFDDFYFFHIVLISNPS